MKFVEQEENTSDFLDDQLLKYEDVFNAFEAIFKNGEFAWTGSSENPASRTKSGHDLMQVPEEIAKKIKTLAQTIPNRPPFNNMEWWKRFQFLYNAYIVESKLLNAFETKLSSLGKCFYGDAVYNQLANPNSDSNLDNDSKNNTHTIFGNTKTYGVPDLVFVDTDTIKNETRRLWVEVKMVGNKADLKATKLPMHLRALSSKTNLKNDVIIALGFILKDSKSNPFTLVWRCALQNENGTGYSWKNFFECPDLDIKQKINQIEQVAEAEKENIYRSILKFELKNPDEVKDTDLLGMYKVSDVYDLKYKDKTEEEISKNNDLEDLTEEYWNKLDISKALINKDECIDKIKSWYSYDGDITTGGFFIMPDGTIIKTQNHADIDKYLIKAGYISLKDGQKLGELDYGDGSQFMDAINCVRIRRRGGRDSWILPYCVLPNNNLTTTQYNILEHWLEQVLNKSQEVQVSTQTEQSKVYKAWNGYTAQDIIDSIKMFYRSKFLEELGKKPNYDFIFDDLINEDLDNTDYELEKDLSKGYLDQF